VSDGGKAAIVDGMAESVSSKVYNSVKTEMSSPWSKKSEGSEFENGMVVAL
jgi:tRNA threonylcarbamoyladenosine modification (KEOPS) complex  Pcc1 subunit